MPTPEEVLKDYLKGITDVQKGLFNGDFNQDYREVERQRVIFQTAIRWLSFIDGAPLMFESRERILQFIKNHNTDHKIMLNLQLENKRLIRKLSEHDIQIGYIRNTYKKGITTLI